MLLTKLTHKIKTISLLPINSLHIDRYFNNALIARLITILANSYNENFKITLISTPFIITILLFTHINKYESLKSKKVLINRNIKNTHIINSRKKNLPTIKILNDKISLIFIKYIALFGVVLNCTSNFINSPFIYNKFVCLNKTEKIAKLDNPNVYFKLLLKTEVNLSKEQENSFSNATHYLHDVKNNNYNWASALHIIFSPYAVKIAGVDCFLHNNLQNYSKYNNYIETIKDKFEFVGIKLIERNIIVNPTIFEILKSVYSTLNL